MTDSQEKVLECTGQIVSAAISVRDGVIKDDLYFKWVTNLTEEVYSKIMSLIEE